MTTDPVSLLARVRGVLSNPLTKAQVLLELLRDIEAHFAADGQNVSGDDLIRDVEADPVGRVNLSRARRMTAVARFFRDALAARPGGETASHLAVLMRTTRKRAERLLTNEAPDRITLEMVFLAADVLGVEITFTRKNGDSLSCPPFSAPVRTVVQKGENDG